MHFPEKVNYILTTAYFLIESFADVLAIKFAMLNCKMNHWLSDVSNTTKTNKNHDISVLHPQIITPLSNISSSFQIKVRFYVLFLFIFVYF